MSSDALPFRALLRRSHASRALFASGLAALALHALALLAYGLVPTSRPALRPRVESELVVTLLDAPRLALPRALGGEASAAEPRAPASATSAANKRSPRRARAASGREPVRASTVGAPAQTSAVPSAALLAGASAREGAPNALSQGTGSSAGTGAPSAITSGDTEVLPFRDGMSRPVLISKVDPVYTREARDAHVEGLILTKCVITTAGALRNCRVVKGIPAMDGAVLSALARWRYEPVRYQGKAVSVEYVIPIRLVGP